ncbi:MAG: SGNH/GDSL hydrolase family protein, partial [Bacteroidota bacterium]
MRILLGILSLSLCWLGGNAQSLDSCITHTPRHVVVIGSSTAAGTGASVPDSAWVNRYRRYLKSLHPGYEVSNLAKGGYQTYHLMPTGFVPPPGRTQPDTLRNITQALSLDPDAIIVNLPSNDAAASIPVSEQMQNFRAMQALAKAQKVSFWVCTPQPRIFDSSKVAIQWALLDSVESDFAPKVLDFWDQIAEPSGLPSPLYDAGDGIHLNDLGHRIL